MTDINLLAENIRASLASFEPEIKVDREQITLEILSNYLLPVAEILRTDKALRFEMLLDVCGVDYSAYGIQDWETTSTTYTGFSRGVEKRSNGDVPRKKHRFAVVYHFLSLTHNQRVRVRIFAENDQDPSIMPLWDGANWFEREAFDLFGIKFEGHPDLRRILTDYGFKGHPFRKDFPVIGEVEPRFDAAAGRVIYEPVTSIEPRTLVPKVIRKDNRYTVNDHDPRSFGKIE
jgi:NADH-quinone oxidoreductase subunit C